MVVGGCYVYTENFKIFEKRVYGGKLEKILENILKLVGLDFYSIMFFIFKGKVSFLG